jgi:hypothetical protein
MSQSITTVEQILIEKNISVAGVDSTPFTPEYKLTMKLGGNSDAGIATTRISDLFTTATYQQSTENPDVYNVIIVPDLAKLATVLNGSEPASTSPHLSLSAVAAAAPLPSRDGEVVKASQKLLDVMSLNLFGTDVAQAAITNDSDFLAIDLPTLVNTALNADADQIFQRYVQLGGIAGQDITQAQEIDFDRLNINSIQIPLRLNGEIMMTGTSYDWVFQKPGFTSPVVDGVYNIDILLDFNVDVPRS